MERNVTEKTQIDFVEINDEFVSYCALSSLIRGAQCLEFILQFFKLDIDPISLLISQCNLTTYT